MDKYVLLSAVMWMSFYGTSAAGDEVGVDTSASVDVDLGIGEDAATPALPEDTVDACQDNVDNDLDGHVDCTDQDCQVFALCVGKTKTEVSAKTPLPPGDQPETSTRIVAGGTSVTLYHSGTLPERKRQCSDGIDNNGNGLTDCQETSCQRSFYCRREMYEYPKEGNPMPGLFVDFGFGAALPNYRVPRATTDSMYGEIPFDPDAGAMVDLQIGFLPIKWVGIGFNFKSAATFASNQYTHNEGGDEDYKYWGYKTWQNIGGFLRFQFPVDRFVPYLNAHFGYSVARNRWNVYDDANSWDDIWDHESDDFWPIEGERDERYSGPKRHFTFAFEPGIDIFVVKHFFGVGIKGWLPVVASHNSERDNVGVMLSFIFTPSWRGTAVLKEKYRQKPTP